MANRIKGITVEIGGDTTKLDKALSGVNKEIKTTQSELKDVERLLKLDPSNTELLAQKQKLLKEAIGQTNDKLKALKDAQEQAKRQLESGELGQDKYDALCREIQSTEIELRRLTEQAEKTGTAMSRAFEQAGEKMKAAGKKISDIGGTLTKTVTAPLAAVGTASVAAFSDLDKGLDIVATKTGATGAALDELKDSTKAVFGELAVTSEEAGTAIGEVNTRFGQTGELLQDTSAAFLKFAKINGTDLNGAIDDVDSIMRKFGVDASQVGNVLGLLTKAGQDTGISVDTLEKALTTNGATFKELGFNLEQSVNLMAQMEKNGVETSTALAGLKKSVANAAKEGKSASQAINDTVNAIKGAKSQTEALTIATELFGSKGAAEMVQAIREGRLSIDDLSSSLGDYGDVVNNTFEATQDATDKAKVAMNNLKIAGAEVGAELLTALEPALDSIIQMIRSLTSWFNSLDDGTKKVVGIIAIIMAAVGPLLIFIGKIISSVGAITAGIPKMISAIKTLGTAIKGLFGIIMAHPFVAIIAAVAALIVALVDLYNNNEEFRKEVDIIWNAILLTIQDVIDAIVGFFTETIPDAFTTAVEAVGDFCQGVIDFFVNLGRGIGTTIGNIASSIINGIMAAVDFITSLPGKALQWGIDFVQGLINGIKSMAGKVIDAVSSVADTIFGWLHFSRPDEGPLRKYETWMPDFMSGLAEGIKDNKWRIEDAVSDVAKAMTINAGDVVGATTNTAVYNTTKVYLGDKELTAQLTGGVVKNISNTQEAGARMKGAAYV